jgi:Glycosyltransferase family 10 (fucosyltransferase) C-term
LALENQQQDDYTTEKIWGALAAGTLPVYWGAPNIKDHVPPHSIIVVDDFALTDSGFVPGKPIEMRREDEFGSDDG